MTQNLKYKIPLIALGLIAIFFANVAPAHADSGYSITGTFSLYGSPSYATSTFFATPVGVINPNGTYPFARGTGGRTGYAIFDITSSTSNAIAFCDDSANSDINNSLINLSNLPCTFENLAAYNYITSSTWIYGHTYEVIFFDGWGNGGPFYDDCGTQSLCRAGADGWVDFSASYLYFPFLNFLYPTNGTTTPPFTQWLVNVYNLQAGPTYSISIHYTPIVNPNTNNNPIYADTSLPFTSTSSNIVIPHTAQITSLGSVTSTFTVNATAYLTETVSNGSGIIGSTTISFTAIPRLSTNNGVTIGTSTVVTPTLNASGTLSLNVGTDTTDYGNLAGGAATDKCTPASSPTDVGGGIAYGLCAAGQFLFTPNSNFTYALQTGYTSIGGAFPFSLVFGIHNVLESSTNQFTNTSTDMAIVLPAPAGFVASGTPPVPLLNSSTLLALAGGGSNGASFKDLMMTIEGALFIVGAVMILYLQVAGK